VTPSVWERSRRSRNLAAYALAVLLPIIAAELNRHFPILHYVPFALYFLSVAVVASISGLWPAILTACVSILARAYYLNTTRGHFVPHTSDLLATLVLVVCALLVSLFTRSRRNAMSQLEERTQALVESLHSGKCASWTIDLDSGKSARWFSGSYPVFGRPFAEIERLPSLTPLLYPDDQLRMPTLIHHMRTSTEPVVFDYRVVWPDGELHYLECRGTRVPGDGCLWRGVTVDVTEHKLAEMAILRSEKLAAMGRLASTVAHEINNPLESVTNLLYLANSDSNLAADTKTYLATAESELARLGNITRLTLGFVRTNEARTPTQISTVVENVLSIFNPRIEAKQIRIQRDIQPAVSILAAPHELRQILTNLVANAIDAVSTHGALLAIRIAAEQDSAVICIDDNGTGIAAAHLPRIFEPFFTTKDDVGTGIGLWVTRELVEKNAGHISVISRDSETLPAGISTRFCLQFPLAPAESPAVTPIPELRS
jgi:signal transduction histidine kinase